MFLGTYLFRTSCLAPLTKKIAKQGGARQGGARHLDQPPLQSKGGWTSCPPPGDSPGGEAS
jgi:hypothetical protein